MLVVGNNVCCSEGAGGRSALLFLLAFRLCSVVGYVQGSHGRHGDPFASKDVTKVVNEASVV